MTFVSCRRRIVESRGENPCFRLPHCRLTPSLQWTPSNIGTSLDILAETRVIGLHLCGWQYRSIFIQIFTVSSERRTCFETERIMTLQGHPRSLILASIESPYMTSYSTSIVTLVLSCRVSEILELLYAERPVGSDVWVAKSEHPRLTDGEIIFEESQPMWSQSTNVTDRRTDRQTDRQHAIAIPRFALKCIAP